MGGVLGTARGRAWEWWEVDGEEVGGIYDCEAQSLGLSRMWWEGIVVW